VLIGELNCLWPQTQTLADLLHGGDDRLCLAASLAAPLLLRLLIDQIGSDDAQRERLLGCGEDAHDYLQQAAILQAGLQQLTGGQLRQFVRAQVDMFKRWGDAFLCIIGGHRVSPPLPGTCGSRIGSCAHRVQGYAILDRLLICPLPPLLRLRCAWTPRYMMRRFGWSLQIEQNKLKERLMLGSSQRRHSSALYLGYGHPACGAGARTVRIWPVRDPSAIFSAPFHSVASDLKFAAPTFVRAVPRLRPSGVWCRRSNREDLACA